MIHATRFLQLVERALTEVEEMDVHTVVKKQASGSAFFFIDTREDHEWQQGHCAGAVHLGKGVIERDIESLIPNCEQEIVLYCGGGFRSALAAQSLQAMGYTSVYSMTGGIRAWAEAGLPLVLQSEQTGS